MRLVVHPGHKTIGVEDIVKLVKVESENSGAVIVEGTAGENLGGHRAICTIGGFIRHADSIVQAYGVAVLGITLDACSSGGTCKYAVFGRVVEQSWSWNTSLPVYAGRYGVLTQIPPTSGFCIVIGTPIDSKTLLVKVGEPILL